MLFLDLRVNIGLFLFNSIVTISLFFISTLEYKNMISTLRSINSLLNQFDELSKFHSNLLTDFDNNFSDIKNPLRHVNRIKDEEENTTTSALFEIDENNDALTSIGPLEDFHRHILKSRFLHRPPNYSSTSKLSSISTESVSLSKIILTTNKENTLSPIVLTSNNRIIQSKVKVPIKDEPKYIPRRRQVRGKITAFTVETINRLSKPRIYNRIPDPKPDVKQTQQPPKPMANVKKEGSKSSTLPPTKRTKTNTKNSSSKKLKIENRIPIQTSSKKAPVRHFSRPLVLITSIPTVRPHVPTQTQQKSSRNATLPKITTTTKRSTIPSKT